MLKNKEPQGITKTLRGRLSLWYIATVGFIILSFLSAVSVLFWFTLEGQIDHHIHITVNEAHQIVQDYKGEERNTLIKNLVSAQGMTVIVLSPDGSAVLETNSPDIALTTEHQLQKLLLNTALQETTPKHFTESNIRFAALPVQVDAGKGLVAVGYSTQVLYSTFYKMLWIVLGVFIFLVLPITYIAHKLLKNQLRPLEKIASQAKQITSTSQLSKKIEIEDTTEELQTITKALNTMLEKLDGIFRNEHEFFSDAAHTLKTPLAVLRSQVENLVIGQSLKKEILATIDSANDTIKDLLFLSKIGTKNPTNTSFSLSTLLKNLTELATALGETNQLKVSSNIVEDIFFKGDEKLFQRALSNVIHNAVVYNRPKGIIDIALYKQHDKIIITVRDTGMGISKNDQPQIFHRFSRGRNTKHKGSGLGLAITKSVIESSGGKLALKSTLNKGTTVTITL